MVLLKTRVKKKVNKIAKKIREMKSTRYLLIE